jgi:hypothetical protein
MVGRSKERAFSSIKDRIDEKLQGWNEKFLSKARREVLIKEVAQSIPTFTMSCFKLPIDFYEEVNAMIAKFWWEISNSGRKIHWRNGKTCAHQRRKEGLV